jgi:hypothetical protein
VCVVLEIERKKDEGREWSRKESGLEENHEAGNM